MSDLDPLWCQGLKTARLLCPWNYPGKNTGVSCQSLCSCCLVIQSCLTLCDPMDGSTPGFPVHRQLPELAQTHVHQVGDAIQPSHPLSSPSPPALNLSQHQGLFQWVSSSHQVAKVLNLQLHESIRTFSPHLFFHLSTNLCNAPVRFVNVICMCFIDTLSKKITHRL